MRKGRRFFWEGVDRCILQTYTYYTMAPDEILHPCAGFQWDEGNIDKNWLKHGITTLQCEQMFFNAPLVVTHDPGHSRFERRYFALGKTDMDKPLFCVFTVRRNLIRVISCRAMSKKEREVYRGYEKENT